MKMKNSLRLAVCLAMSMGMAFSAACASEGGTEGPIKWVDGIERPTITPPEVLGGYPEYPDAPVSKPVVDTTAKTSVESYTAKGGYTLTTTAEGTQMTYTEIGDWDYIYVSVKDYQSQYGNFKMTLNTTGAERIAVQAIYYEMYENDEKPVTVHVGDLADGEQFVVVELSKFNRLDEVYNPIANASLADATILGFALFIDSNPAQTATADKQGSAIIKSFEFLTSDDEALGDRYVVPKVNWSGAFGDVGYTVAPTTGGGMSVSYESIAQWSRVYIPIVNFSKDYAEFEITLTTSGVDAYSVGVLFSTENHTNWQDYVELQTVTNVTDGEHTHSVNFDGANPIDMSNGWNPVQGEFIKNYQVKQIVIWFDSAQDRAQVATPVGDYSGEATVNSIEFARTATEGCTVGKAWSTQTPAITIGSDLTTGGYGTVEYSYYTDWFKLSMPVSSYSAKSKLTVQFMADPIDYCGIVIIAGSTEITLHSGWEKLATTASPVTDASGTAADGTVYTIAKDENNIYTISFDFTNAKKDATSGLAFWEQTVTGLGFYFNDPNGTDSWDGARTIKFLSITFAD